MDNVKRIQLLAAAEISDLYDRPEFSSEEREWHFTLNQEEQKALSQYLNLRTKVYFILQLGYFRAKKQFFSFTFEEVSADTSYILAAQFGRMDKDWKDKLSRDSIRSQKREILRLFDYQDWSASFESQTITKICELLRYFSKGHSALRQLLLYMERQGIVMPSYRTCQDMFTAAFSAEEDRLKPLLTAIPVYWRNQLTELIDQEDGLNNLNLLRADQKDFQYTAVRFETEKARGIDSDSECPRPILLKSPSQISGQCNPLL